MGIFINTIFLMVFAFCGWLAYQGVVQGDPAATFVGVCGGAGFSIIAHSPELYTSSDLLFINPCGGSWPR